MAKYFRQSWTGNFTKTANLSLSAENVGAAPAAVGDFNADGHQDVLLFYYESNLGEDLSTPTNGRASLLLGDGRGHFSDGSSLFPDGGIFNFAVRKVSVGDFNGDGHDDLALATNYEDGRTTTDPLTNAAPQVLLVSGGGRLSLVDLGMTVWGHNLAAGDLNSDGRDDLILGGFTLPEGAPSGTARFFQQADGSMSPPDYMLDFSGIASVVGDFDGDGVAELVDFAGDSTVYGLRLTQLSPSGELLGSTVEYEHAIRTESGEGWNGPSTFSIMLDNNGNEFVDLGWEDLKVADIDGDGRDDIVAGRGGFDLHYVDGVLTQTGSVTHNEFNFYSEVDGNLVRSPNITIEGWTPSRFGPLEFELLDWNGDGHIDLFVEWTYDTPTDPRTGARIYLNDGAGHLYRLKQSYLPDTRTSDGNYNKALVPMDANEDGIMDLLVRPDGTGKSWSQYGASSETLYLGTKKFYTGPNYTDPALKGAAGFNEQYYLNTYADAAKAVSKGKFDNGLEHYLEVGRKKGYFGFAVDTHIFGSDENDTIKAREGEEQLDGGLGKDTLFGRGSADTFVFSTKLGSTNVDTIKDFKPGQGDQIALDRDIFRKIGGALEDNEFFAKKDATKAHDRDDRIVYDTKSGKLYYDADGNKAGGKDAIHFATLSNKAVLDAGDFVIV